MPAFDHLKDAFTQLHPGISPEEINYLASIVEEKTIPKKELFIREGEVQKHLGFVHRGLLRAYYIDEQGETITIRFVEEGGFATHYAALIQGKASRYLFECLEESTLLLLPLQRIKDGYEQFIGLERLGRLIAEQVLIAQQERIEDFQFLTAEERYRKFIQHHPDLFHGVSLSHLATYLGIRRPSLSRIRKKISQS